MSGRDGGGTSAERVPCEPPAAQSGRPVCGHTDMQGFDVVLECVRPPHADDLHRTDIGQRWRCDGLKAR